MFFNETFENIEFEMRGEECGFTRARIIQIVFVIKSNITARHYKAFSLNRAHSPENVCAIMFWLREAKKNTEQPPVMILISIQFASTRTEK